MMQGKSQNGVEYKNRVNHPNSVKSEKYMLGRWIEAARLRTLPVGISGVVAGIGCAVSCEKFSLIPALLCLIFAVLAQIASNFGNEYYDFKNGIDRKGRDGFRRGVTEGDIAPDSMKYATYITLACAATVGCMMLFYGGIWLLPVGLLIGFFALAYSAGPYPLSHHGLGDIAVIIFFGILPVTLTAYLQCGNWLCLDISLPMGLSVGLMANNVLIVNNYRDMDDDKAVGKITTVVLFGRKFMGWIYLFTGIVAVVILLPLWIEVPIFSLLAPIVYLILHIATWRQLMNALGVAINPLLGKTALNLMLFTILLLISFIVAVI